MRRCRTLSRFSALASSALLLSGLFQVAPARLAAGSDGNANLHLDKTVSSAILTPSLGLTLSTDRTDAIPGDAITYSAVVTNTGATLTLHGNLSAGNTSSTTATIASYWDAIGTTSKSHCGADPADDGLTDSQWQPFAGTAAAQSGYLPVKVAPIASGMDLSLTPAAASGVTYPKASAPDQILGTSLAPGATAIWHYEASVPLTKDQVSFLLDPAKVSRIRNSFHAEPTPRTQNGNGQPDQVNVDFCGTLAAGSPSGNATDVTVTVGLPDGSTKTIGKGDVAALASLPVGSSVTVKATYGVRVPAAKGANETDAAYVARLAAMDGSPLSATASAKAAGSITAGPTIPVVTTVHLPILSLGKTGPGQIERGHTAAYDLSLANSGSAFAAGLTLTDALPDGDSVPVTGVPSSLAPAASATAHSSYSIPNGQPAGNLTDIASLRWTDANGNVYGPISSSATTNVIRPTVAVTVTASSGSMSYGDEPPAITPTYSGWVDGEGPAVLTTPPTCFATATSQSGAGTYKTSCTGAAAPFYTFVYVDGSVIVSPVALTVTASSGAMTFGHEPPAITPAYSGFLNGDGPSVLTTAPTCSTSATKTSPIGTYKSSCSGAVGANYTFSYVDGAVEIGAATVTVTASSGSMTYGDQAPAITPTYSGWAGSDGPSVLTTAPTCTSTASSASPVGSYGSSCSGAVAPNYAFTYVDGAVAVKPALVTVTASSGSMSYGATPPAVTPAYSGWVNGEDASVLTAAPTCSTTAISTSSAGTYPASCSGATATNYTFTYVAGTVSVDPKSVLVTASSASITYGDALPAITPSYSGFLNGDGPSVLTTAPVCSTEATGASGAGTYKTSCSGAAAANYTFTYADGAVDITPALVTVVAPSGSMTYGDTPPALVPAYSGWIKGEDASVLTKAAACSTTAKASSSVGSYKTSCSGATAANYTFAYLGGTMTVNPAPLSVTASSATMTYGDPLPAIAPAYSGWANDDGPSDLATSPTCSTAATAMSGVGTYKSACSGAAAANYTITYVDGSVTVAAATVTVTASSDAMTVGHQPPAVTPTYSGWVNGESGSVLTTAPLCSTSATSSSPIGSYKSSCTGAAAANYTFDYVDGTVEVSGVMVSHLVLTPQVSGPFPVGSTQIFTVTASDSESHPMAGVPIALTVVGPNPATTNLTTDSTGKATYTYTGSQPGTDTAQATAVGGTVSSNTASVVWMVPVSPISTTAIHATFYGASVLDNSFKATPASTPLFSQDFPSINFNAPTGAVLNNQSGVNENTKPFTDVLTGVAGEYTGTIVASGNGYTAATGSLLAWNTVFSGNYTIATPGDYTFDFYSDDGWLFGIGGGATRVSGPMNNAPTSGKTVFSGFDLMAAYNAQCSPTPNQVTVHFPTVGVYPFELDYFEAHGGAAVLTVALHQTGQAVPALGSLTLSPPGPPSLYQGQTGTYTVAAMDAAGDPIAGLPISFSINGVNSNLQLGTTDANGLADFSYMSFIAGTDRLQATAYLAAQPLLSNTVNQSWSGLPPRPAITDVSPAEGTVITVPTPITADIIPPPGLTASSWQVTYRPLNGTLDVSLASGSGAPPATLATLDPTVLQNGSYNISIKVTLSSFTAYTMSFGVIVDGDLKLGRYQVTYKDADVAVGGIPIQVLRTYDSFDKSQGDFGIGWRLSLADFRLYANGSLGAGGWSQYASNCIAAGLGGGFCTMAWQTARPHYVTVVWPDGHTETFDFTPSGGSNLFWFGSAAFTGRSGTTSKLAVDGDPAVSYFGDGNLYAGLAKNTIYAPTRFRLTAKDGTVYVLDATSGLVSETDRLGNTVTVDSTGIHSSLGPSITFTRNGNQISKITKPDGTTVTYGTTYPGNLTSVTDERNYKVTYQYDSKSNLTKTLDPNNKPMRVLTYGSDGRLQTVTDGDGNVTTVNVDPNARTETVTGPDPRLTTISSMDERGDIVQVDQIFGGKTLTTKFKYDDQGNILSKTDPLNHTTSATYNAANSPLTLTEPDGGVWTFTYNDHEQLTSIKDRTGRVVATLTYDQWGELTKRTTADGDTIYTYDNRGLLKTVTDPLSRTNTYGYDSAGRVLTVTGPDSRVWTYTYDADGRTKTITDPASQQTTFNYDNAGNLTGFTDANSHGQIYTYDPLGRLATATDGLGHTTTYGYDLASRLTSVLDRNGQTTRFEYDAAGQVTKVTLPGGSLVTYTNDPLGQLTEADDADATLGFTYDDLGNLASQTSAGTATSSQPTVTLAFGRDASGRPTSLAAPWGTTGFGYDTNGLLASVTDPSGGVFDFAYDPLGRLSSLTRPNGVTDTYTYDVGGELRSRSSAKAASVIDALAYGYDASGRVSSKTDATGTTTYGYDDADRLISVLAPMGSTVPNETFSYDGAGNQTQAGQTYDAANRLLSDSRFDYIYDGEGNLRRKTERSTNAVTTYTWNALHEMTSATLPDGTTVTFRYDALGRRVEESSSAGTTRFVNLGANVVAEYDGGNTLRATYLTTLGQGDLPGTPLEVTSGSTVRYPLLDLTGSVTALTDSTGSISSGFSYSAYGVPLGSSSGTYSYGTFGYDLATGLYYARARYYDPATGGFLSEDPIPHLNLYGYTSNNPIGSRDPTGRFELSAYGATMLGSSLTINFIGATIQWEEEQKTESFTDTLTDVGFAFGTNMLMTALGVIAVSSGVAGLVMCAIGVVTVGLAYAWLKGEISASSLDTDAGQSRVLVTVLATLPNMIGLPIPFTYFQPTLLKLLNQA